MGNGVSTGRGNLPSRDRRDVSDGSANMEQYDWSEQAEAPETNTLLADPKPYTPRVLIVFCIRGRNGRACNGGLTESGKSMQSLARSEEDRFRFTAVQCEAIMTE